MSSYSCTVCIQLICIWISVVYQSEGPTVWVPVPGRDVSCLQAGSFHNLIPQGQHVTFTPTQAGHVSTGIYHPNQTVAAGSVHPLLQQLQARAGTTELMGPPAGAYQQPQHAAINWVNNYWELKGGFHFGSRWWGYSWESWRGLSIEPPEHLQHEAAC